MATGDGIYVALHFSGQKWKIVSQRTTDEQQRSLSDKRLKTFNDRRSGLFKSTADGGGCFATRFEDKNSSPQSLTHAQEVAIDFCATKDKGIRPTRNATVGVTY